ncbi:MAG: hypothetical protein GX874_00190 [Smithella sp.]|nr:hypothetical protein [Smithella sp.]
MKITLLKVVVISLFSFCQIAFCDRDIDELQKEIEALIEKTDTENDFFWQIYVSETDEKDPEKRTAIMDERRRINQRTKSEWENVEKQLASMGEVVIDPLLNKYESVEYLYYRPMVIRVIGQLGTTKSQEILKDIALGRGVMGKQTSPDAAMYYIKNLTDNRMAIDFIDSGDRNVISQALSGLYRDRVSVDMEIFTRVSPFLKSDDFGLRVNAARVFAADPNDTFVSEKVKAIIQSIETASELPNASEAIDSKLDGIETKKGSVYLRMIAALSEMKGADDALSEIFGKLDGETKLCVAIAMGNRGHESVKAYLWAAFNHQEFDLPIRTLALRTLGIVGNKTDLPELKKYENDTLIQTEWNGAQLLMNHGKIISKNLSKPPWADFDMDAVYNDIERSRKRYPVRESANQAIKMINDREN